MKNIKIAFVALTVVVALITLFIRIPLPSRGYFNLGDVAVVFDGEYHLLQRQIQQARYRLLDAPVGLVGDHPIHVLDRQPLQIQHRLCDFRHVPNRHAEGLASVQPQGVTFGVDALVGDGGCAGPPAG